MGKRKVFDLVLLLEGFTVKEINTHSTYLGVKIEGTKKVEKIQNFIHHKNLGPDKIIEYFIITKIIIIIFTLKDKK